MSRARTRTAVLSAGLVVLAALGACTGQQPPGPTQPMAVRPDPRPIADEVLNRAIEQINQRGTARTSVRGDLGMVGELDADGAVRYGNSQTDIELAGQTHSSRPNPLQLAVVDGVGYVNTPMAQPAPGKPWLRIDPGAGDFGAKLLGPALQQMHQAVDPRATFTGVEQATRVQSSAPDDVDGRPATRYDLRVRTEQAAKMAPDEQQRKRFEEAAHAGEREMGFQLWIDGSGAPVKFTATEEVKQAGQVSLTSTYRDWGSPVAIEPPPTEEVGVFEDAPPVAQPPR
ncbi:hypothetical protein [Saccharopolyspora griseoalba]|uniref:Lipoprotein n=1 Tax=Saccharopolyspora griseoalba TaxID=1431848 RepID=A0ABW2LIS0_9PSEU